MPNLKEIRGRIKGIKSTQKITKAMKMVATAKLKKMRDALLALKDYTLELENIISNTVCHLAENEIESLRSNPFVAKNPATNPHLIIFNTSNKGLCGGINNYNIKKLKESIANLEAKNRAIIIYTIGKKGYDYCKAHFEKYLHNQSPVMIEFKNAINIDFITKELTALIQEKAISSSEVVFTEFVNTTTQNTNSFILTPLHGIKKESKQAFGKYEFNDDKIEILKRLIPEFVSTKILTSIFENATSEQAARMVAMENATNNTTKAIKTLTLVYNRIRQAGITREISEIVSGVESVKQV